MSVVIGGRSAKVVLIGQISHAQIGLNPFGIKTNCDIIKYSMPIIGRYLTWNTIKTK
jgi:hypothetical protein